MKIRKKPQPLYYTTEITDICCSQAQQNVGKSIFSSESGVVIMTNEMEGYVKITHCPFCGQKIEEVSE
jgi:hypothetical protein